MSTIKDVVQDVVKMTASLGIVNFVKVEGDASTTKFDAVDTERTVIIKAKLHDALSEFTGVFGFGNLAFLNGISGIRTYKEDGATVEMVMQEKDGATTPQALLFKDTQGNNDRYRLMNERQVLSTFENIEFNSMPNWDITVEPTKQKVSELQEIAGIYGGIEPNFSLKTQDGNLIVTVGDTGGSFVGKRTFATNVTGELGEGFSWPLTQFLSVLKLGMTAQCTLHISAMGALQITIDTGIGEYNYILPALSV